MFRLGTNDAGPEVLLREIVLEEVEAHAGVDGRAFVRPPVLHVDAHVERQVRRLAENGSACCWIETGTPLLNV